jgi:uncharacterized membrane protein YphA (DoxX/SURF4 family)
MKKLRPYVWLALRLWLGLVFAYAGFSKLTEPIENFRAILAQYEIIPYSLVPYLAPVLPWIELTFGIFLMLGYLPRVSALVLSLLSFGLLLILAGNWIFFKTFPASCGCFGQGGIQLTPLQVFFLDLANGMIGLGLFFVKKHIWSLEEKLKTPDGARH